MATEQPACRRCRTQKLRCDRKAPECARCIRIGAACSYPEPPDRKLIAARRKPPRSRAETLKPKLDKPTVKAEVSVKTGTDLDISEQHTLIDLYFTGVFKSSLLYHRPSFEKALEAGNLPRHALLAVYALGMNLLVAETLQNREQRAQLQHLGDFRKLGEIYALAAGKEVLQEIDRPSLDCIQTCHNLGYFWFARADSHRNAMFSGISYRAARSLLMDPALLKAQTWLEGEMTRRCFWAGWLQSCVNSDDYVTGSAADSLALDTRLPVSEPAFATGQEETRLTLSQALARSPQGDTFSLWAHFLTFLFFWAKVRDHIASRRTSTQSEVLTNLLNLQQELSDWVTTMHPSLAYSKKNLFEQVVYKQDSIFSALHTMLHHCRLTLHSSLVPRFSGNLSCSLPAEVIKMSTEASIRSAAGLAEIANDLIAFDCDYSKLPPYVGYCMYVAASIHVTMISSSALGVTARKNLALNMTVLQGMKPFWAILERLWQRLVTMCETHAAKGLFSMESILPPGSTGNDLDADALDRPIPAYSLTVVKEEPRVDQLAAMNQMTPPDDSPLIQSSATNAEKIALNLEYPQQPGSLDDLHETSFDFDDLANTYGEDWWQLDPTILQPGNSIDLQWA